MNDAELLAFHRALVRTPSVSHQERAICDFVQGWLGERGVDVHRVGDNVFAMIGRGPILCMNSHLDTVPPTPAWTRDPYDVRAEDGKVFGLGSNDAKASVAAMTAAFLRLQQRQASLDVRLMLALTCEEETGGKGAEMLVPELRNRGLAPAAAVVGEPTALDVAVAQKGLLIVELKRSGKACHAANARTLGIENPIRRLAADIVGTHDVDWGSAHEMLGDVTAEPTVLAAGSARNTVPAEATCVFDVRTNPEPGHEVLVQRLRQATSAEVRVISDRLKPCEIRPDHPLVQAARRARPESETFGSRTLSDMVFFRGIPTIKVGPGRTERSHTPDEFVLESEIIEGAHFYEHLALEFARQERSDDAALGSR